MFPLAIVAVKKFATKSGEVIAASPTWVKVVLALALCSLVTSLYTDHVVSKKYKAEIKAIHADYEDKANKIEIAYEDAAKALAADNKKLFDEQELKLGEINLQKVKTITIVKEVKKYVTQKADDAAVIPSGFVWMHNATLADQNATVALSEPGDVDQASGVALSTIASVIGTNNAECVARGRIIELWQEWWATEKVIYEKAQATIAKAVSNQ